MNIDEKKIEERRAYKRAWNAAHKDKVKAAQKRYFEKLVRQEAEKLLQEKGYTKTEA